MSIPVQIISKDGKVVCVRVTPYDPKTLKSIKQAGYKVKESIINEEELFYQGDRQ